MTGRECKKSCVSSVYCSSLGDMHDEIPASYRLVPIESCSKEIDPVLSFSKQEGSRNGCDDDDDDDYGEDGIESIGHCRDPWNLEDYAFFLFFFCY